MRKLAYFGVLLAFCVVALGAFTRLTDAGLGCPDWPGCYGHYTVPTTDHHIARAEAAFPDRPVEAHKAWNEMIHRYFAGTLGLLVLAMAVLALVRKAPQAGLALLLLALVTFQALLGMWTVTLNLKPVVVMAHLLGGFATLSLLWLLGLRLSGWRLPGGDPWLRRYQGFALAALGVLVVQIALGGWTASNYAALVCTQLPICEGDWWTRLHPVDAFNLLSPPADNYEFGVLDYEARMTIHISHRIWALVTAAVLLALGWTFLKKARTATMKKLALAMLALLTVQLGLGVANVVLSLPLTVAVAHNLVAALLLLSLVTINYALWRKA